MASFQGFIFDTAWMHSPRINGFLALGDICSKQAGGQSLTVRPFEDAGDHLDGSSLIFRATEMMTAETEYRDSDACFAELSKRGGHVTRFAMVFWEPDTNSMSAFTMAKRVKTEILRYG